MVAWLKVKFDLWLISIQKGYFRLSLKLRNTFRIGSTSTDRMHVGSTCTEYGRVVIAFNRWESKQHGLYGSLIATVQGWLDKMYVVV